MFLHLSVSHSVHRGCLPIACWDTPLGQLHPSRQVHPTSGRYPPGRYTPLRSTPPGRYHPPARQVPSWQVHPPTGTPLGRYTPCPLPTRCMLAYGQQEGGTHPIGMQPCYYYYYSVLTNTVWTSDSLLSRPVFNTGDTVRDQLPSSSTYKLCFIIALLSWL